MKKEKSLFGMFMRDLAYYAAEIALVAGAIIGILYVVNLLAECLRSFITVESGLLVLFSIAGSALYIDFRPEIKPARGRRGESHLRSVRASSNKLVRTCSSK